MKYFPHLIALIMTIRCIDTNIGKLLSLHYLYYIRICIKKLELQEKTTLNDTDSYHVSTYIEH